MRQLKLLSTAILLLSLGLTSVKAQEAIVASGGEVIGGGTVSYTVGQMVSAVSTGTNGTVTPGVQQTFEITVIAGVEDRAIHLEVSAYPNPTTDFLTLHLESENPIQNSVAFLSDINGRLIQQIEIESNRTHIPMKDLSGTLFFLKVINDNRELKTFKIIKK